jgi:hypothetical protein
VTRGFGVPTSYKRVMAVTCGMLIRGEIELLVGISIGHMASHLLSGSDA